MENPTVTITRITETDALFCHYGSQYQQQPVYLTLDLEDGELTADYDPEVGPPYGIPESVYNHRTLRIDIPCLTADAANRLLDDAAPIAQQILSGSEIEFDGRSNKVGRLNADANAAFERLAALCDAERFDESETVSEWDAADWFGGEGREQTITRLGLTADTTDADVEAMAATETREAHHVGNAGYTVITGAEAYLTDLRNDLREQVRDELETVASEHAKLEDRRDDLIKKLSGWGDSSRSIASRVDLSHTQVQNIAKRHNLTQSKENTMWTLEFRATTIGEANDLARQASPNAPLSASQSGRLGYEVTGSEDACRALETLLTARGETSYLEPGRRA